MKRNRTFRLLATMLAVVLCATALAAPAFASGDDYYASNEDGSSTPPASIDSITISTENVTLLEQDKDTALTPDGNLSLIDDILQSGNYASVEQTGEMANKQFITVQSKNGNYFYLIIDRSGDTENVYFLNMVDEADLLALMEDSQTATTPIVCTCTDKCVAGAVDTSCPVCKNNMSECTGKDAATNTEPEPDIPEEPADEKKGGAGAFLAVLLILAAGGGAAAYFLVLKPKQGKKVPSDLDDFDLEDEEEYLNDDEGIEDE